jgi:flagellin-like hook-associated protein FlgL
MRVTANSYANTYLRNLENVSTEKIKNQIRISTGNDMFNLADGPDRIVDIKQIDNRITENEHYISITDDAINEMQLGHDSLQNISNHLETLRELMIDASSAANSGNLVTFGNYAKGVLNDMVNIANTDYKGKCLFGGTVTRPPSEETGGLNKYFPYEMKEGEPTEENPSGIQIIYKGNQDERIITKDPRTTEKINTIPEKAFGENGTELFETALDIVELLMYDEEGNKRADEDHLDPNDVELVSQLHIKIDDLQHSIDTEAAKLGAVLNRVTLVNTQLKSENVNLAGFRSDIADTDVAKESVELTKNENALQYALKVGSTVTKLSLFDYL